MGPNHVERRRIIAAILGARIAAPLGFPHSTKKEPFRTNNKSAPVRAKLDLRNAPRVAKNDLTTLLINLRCAKCRRVCGQRYDPHDVKISVMFSSTPVTGHQLPFLKGRIYGKEVKEAARMDGDRSS